MHQEPPAHLRKTLESLKICTAREFRAVWPRVRRLARDLPAFDRVWLDALVQARRLTPFQADRLSDEKGPGLKIGPYVLIDRLGQSDLGETFCARPIGRGRPVALKILDAQLISPERAHELLTPALEKLRHLKTRILALPCAWGNDAARFWLASPLVPGPSCTELLIHHGRIPPRLVLELARQLLAGLGELWSHRLVHGDLRPSHVRVSAKGRAVITDAQLRVSIPEAALLPMRALPPDRFDYLAPEAFTTGRAVTTAEERYAVGCLLWHLLTGRPPFPGADPDAKRVARQRNELADVRELAPETPAPLAALIAALMRRDPAERPNDLGERLRRLGASQSGLRRRLSASNKPFRKRFLRRANLRPRRRRLLGAGVLAAAVTLAAIAGATVDLRSARVVTQLLAKISALVPHVQSTDAQNVQDSPTAKEPGTPLANHDAHRVRGVSTSPSGTLPTAAMPSDLDSPITSASFAQDAGPAVLLREATYLARGPYLTPREHPSQRLRLQPNQHVRGAGDRRPLILVLEESLEINVPNVHWENVRFVLTASTNAKAKKNRPPLVLIRAPGVTFRQCSFEVQPTSGALAALVVAETAHARFQQCQFSAPESPDGNDAPARPSAFQWGLHSDDLRNDDDNPWGRATFVFEQCTFDQVSAVHLAAASLPVRLELNRCEQRSPAPLVRLALGEVISEPIHLVLNDCDVEGATAVMEIAYQTTPQRWRGLTITSTNSNYHLSASNASNHLPCLICFHGPSPSPDFVRAIHWTGMGTRVDAPTPVLEAVWDNGSGQPRGLSPELLTLLEIDGVVSGGSVPRQIDVHAGGEMIQE